MIDEYTIALIGGPFDGVERTLIGKMPLVMEFPIRAPNPPRTALSVYKRTGAMTFTYDGIRELSQ